ncbi:hypothetical protein JAAARDRAFT_139351 [Jaapia argillacea MUCL 33604]|uniref:Uncharacterized protein n=1 Tax=Jaapia argillacea MUCL 33604 TaxID=933084 RepID=A0A067PNW7_9AGAM|nr:hypothetical protein JAAARDRAFT_139351 [Jaapia argillacea MUCL 33604]
MPILIPVGSPPLARTKPTNSSSSLSSSTQTTKADAGASAAYTQRTPLQTDSRVYKVPTVILEADRLNNTMAARLAMSLLGHVLFLKSQVPFPVMQLARLPSKQPDTRAMKKRTDLLSSLDILSSHLCTTFTALSTALAKSHHRRSKLEPQDRRAQVYLAMVLGPSVNAAKSRMMLVLDGLDVKVWGSRAGASMESGDFDENAGGRRDFEDEDTSEGEECEEVDSEDEDSGEESGDESGSDCPSESESDCDSASDSQSESSSSETPPSPSPPRSPPHSSSPMVLSVKSNTSRHTSPAPQREPVESEPTITYAEEQQAIKTAERLLSRTLANACADESMESIACELAPTQTHILIRAPRRFSHPSWVPRQMWTSSLEALLSDFLEESGIRPPPRDEDGVGARKSARRRGRGAKCEGVYVGCRSGTVVDEEGKSKRGVDEESGDEDEDGEMIWWSWDGKIVGFSDW